MSRNDQHADLEVPTIQVSGADNLGVILESDDDDIDDPVTAGGRRRSVLKPEKENEGLRSRSESGGGKSVLFNVNGVKQVIIEGHEDEEGEEDTDDDATSKAVLLYKISDSPPIYLTILFGLQQCLLSVVGNLITPFLVAAAVCGGSDEDLLTKLVSTTMFVSGITTLAQVVLGIRLPLYQGPAAAFIIPLLTLGKTDPARCDIKVVFADKYVNGSVIGGTSEADLQDDLVKLRIQELMGPLMICGFIHFMLGFTGVVGFLLRFIGPITIVPTLMLIGLSIADSTLDYVESQWGVTLLVWVVSLALSLYLGSKPMPIPVYSREKGWRFIRYPLHQVLAILIAILIGWITCGILTSVGALTDDPTLLEYNARTDARADSITNGPWFYFPYPGQFGGPGFAVAPFIAFLIATMTSILDSIGDYYACASMCRVPTPPGHAVNRGIAVEGFCTILSGVMGAGHATTTYGGNIGAIGMTKVASRSVFIAMAIIYLVLGLFTKVSAIFVSIPYPVLGGTILTIIGVFVGVNLSNLQVIDLASTRNLSIIGFGIFIGYLVPMWMDKNQDIVLTGNDGADEALKSFLGNPNFIGTMVSCILDNTVPGTLEERGVAAWREDSPSDEPSKEEEEAVEYLEGPEVYDPLIPNRFKSSKIFKYIPIFPYQKDTKESRFDLDRRRSTLPSLDVHSMSDSSSRRNSMRRDSEFYVRRQSALSIRRQSLFSSF